MGAKRRFSPGTFKMPRSLPKNILVVDNDRVGNLKLATLIKRFDYNVFVATNSADYVRMVNSILPHLVLLNLNMPGVEGKTCLEWLRSNKGLDMIHVVVMGEEKDGEELDKSLEKGANAKIIRPAGPSALFRTVEDLMATTSRKVPRLRVIFKVTVTHGKTMRQTYVTSISENGVFVRTMNPLPNGTKLKLSMALPGAKPLELEGEVIYGVQYSSEKFNEPGMAVLFADLPEEVRLGIRKFVDEQLMGDLDPDLLV